MCLKRITRAITPHSFLQGVFLAAMLLAAFPAYANGVSTERTEATLISDTAELHDGQQFLLALHIKMQPGWHTYWKNPGDSGMAPSFTWTLPKGFTAAETLYSPPLRLPLGDMVDYGYENDAWYITPVTAAANLRPNSVSILSLHARWLVCKDTCIPESGDFSVSLPTRPQGMPPLPGEDAAAVAAVARTLPPAIALQGDFQFSSEHIRFSLPLMDLVESDIKDMQFFPEDPNFISNSGTRQYKVENGKAVFVLDAAKGKIADTQRGLVAFFLKDGYRKDLNVNLHKKEAAPPAAAPSPRPSYGIRDILHAALLAFLGGCILNLMPCVFPVLSLKALAVARKAEKHPKDVRLHGLAYASGVVLSFLCLAGLLLFIRAGGQAIGWGYQMQSPVFVASLSIVFFTVGLNLSGLFEMPSLLGNAGGNIAGKDNKLGSFATGVLAVLAATPCTAPFMAPAIGFALTQPPPVIFATFTMLGCGLAAPFLGISLFPRLIAFLPHPGAWMATFREALAFPMYLCTVWLLWVLTREAGTEAMFIVLLSLVFFAFSLWLLRHEARTLSFVGLTCAVLTVIAMIALMHSPKMAVMQAGQEKFSETRLASLRKDNVPVFVDATADWCITCKVNEHGALAAQKVQKAFAGKHIVYMVADWTHGEKEITDYLASFGRVGVPFYVYYPPDGKEPVLLPQLLTPDSIMETIR